MVRNLTIFLIYLMINQSKFGFTNSISLPCVIRLHYPHFWSGIRLLFLSPWWFSSQFRFPGIKSFLPSDLFFPFGFLVSFFVFFFGLFQANYILWWYPFLTLSSFCLTIFRLSRRQQRPTRRRIPTTIFSHFAVAPFFNLCKLRCRARRKT